MPRTVLTIDGLARHIARRVYDDRDPMASAGDLLSELHRHPGALGAAARRLGTSMAAERRFFAKIERYVEDAQRLLANRPDDPADSPIIRHVLYTNDVQRLLATFVQGLLTVSRPERVRAALENILSKLDQMAEVTKRLAETIAKDAGEKSGWREPSEEN